MDTFDAIVSRHLAALVDALGSVAVPDLARIMAGLPDETVYAVLAGARAAMRELEGVSVVAAGVVADRSARDAGQAGLAQKHGHRSAVSLVQQVTGASRHEASKVVRLGQSLLESQADGADAGEPGGLADVPDAPAAERSGAPRPWHAVLADAYSAGRISVEQQAAIRRGLGDPPLVSTRQDSGVGPSPDTSPRSLADIAARDAETRAAWTIAAEQLVDEASRRTVEDLAAAARSIRDQLDPEGAERRFNEKHEARSFRMWRDADGVAIAKIRFESGGEALFTAVMDAALRPRRGGPRFVDTGEKTAAEQLAADPRTNDQLAYDLLMDVLHAGALADAATVFGTRQAGVRVVITRAAEEAARQGRTGVAVIEDTNTTVPAAFAAQHACDTGAVECVLDTTGNSLDLGRDARLFSARQRLALGLRDGGCIWPQCDRPPSYCEAHHIDEYSRGGRTDVDRGVLLCRFHHMNLHHHSWWITRDETGPFVLRSPDPDAAPVVLVPRLERRYAWGDLQPPLTRFRPAA